MHNQDLSRWTHTHQFNHEKRKAENRTLIVVVITVITMLVEIIAGWYFNSMAVFADGWHMMTHAAALSISLIAYVLARRLSKDSRFAFGTWKIEILGAYSSAIVLGIVGVFVLVVSIQRMLRPVAIGYNQALIVAVIGLVVNVICALVLQSGGTHDHGDDDHDDGEHHEHHHHGAHGHHHQHDLNLRSAYMHVLADALTSMLAIIALLGAKFYRWNFLDPLMGIVGAVLIFRWTFQLVRETSAVLLDREMDEHMVDRIVHRLEADGDTLVSDIHIWRVSQEKYACLISLVASEPVSVDAYKLRLDEFYELGHLTIEVNSYVP